MLKELRKRFTRRPAVDYIVVVQSPLPGRKKRDSVESNAHMWALHRVIRRTVGRWGTPRWRVRWNHHSVDPITIEIAITTRNPKDVERFVEALHDELHAHRVVLREMSTSIVILRYYPDGLGPNTLDPRPRRTLTP